MSRLRIASGLAATWLLVGCAAAPSPQDNTGSPGEPVKVQSVGEAPLPNAELTPERLYELLLAEIAVQRGQYPIAAQAYLQAAHATRDPRLARRAARIAIYARDGNRALEASRLWVELAPDETEAHQSYAALLIQDGRLTAAVPHLKRLMQSTDGPTGMNLVTTLLSRAEDKQQALDLFEQLTRGNSSPDVDFASAHLALLAGKPDLALERVKVLLSKEADWSKALVLKSNALRHLGREQEAIEAFRAAVDAEPEDAKLRLSFARLLVDTGDMAAAREQFEELARQMPDSPDVTYALGLLALQAGDLDAAEENLRRLVESGKHVDEAAYALGQIAEQREEFGDAMQWYGSVSQGENYLDARISIASILASTDGVNEATRYLEGLRPEGDQERIRIYLAEGEILREHGHFADSKAVYDRALERYPDNPDLRYARAMVAEKLDRLDLLEQDLLTVLEEDPDNAQALNALGYTLADRTDRYQEAYDYITRALTQAPEDPAILDSMGWVLYRLGRMEEALEYLRRAAAEFADPEVSAHLGEVLWQAGNRQEAKQVWDEASRRDPDSGILKRTRQRFLGR